MLPAILGLSGLALTPDERAFILEADPAGFILFGRNVRNREQLRALTDELRTITGRDTLPILIDQEGGRITRLGPPEWPSTPAAARFAELYRRGPISGMEAARLNGLAIGSMLAQAGISVACLPLLDLHYDDAHGVIGDRALGSDPLEVAALGRFVLDGLAEAGVAGLIKHMPGHGRARADSHHELPVVTASAEELERDLIPFRRLARAPFGMTAHILYTAWDAGRCATVSPVVIERVIRGAIGFTGILISDSLRMQALAGTLGERGLAALAAGCDLVLHCSGSLDDSLALAAALPPMPVATAESLAGKVQLQPCSPDLPDLTEIVRRRDALLALA